MAPICSALNLSDESKCQEEATSADGLFCPFHAKQCYGLYRGYKIRNAKLDALDASPPEYLTRSKVALRNETFADVESEKVLNELHRYLFKKHALLDRVIRARKLHHSRFYPLNLDYGHKAYLDKLTNDKFVVLRALERLERRTAEVLYAQQKWFKWVRECQDEEDAGREKESEMIKREAKLFKRRWKEVEARMRQKKREEHVKRQEAFLDEVYQERVTQMSDEEAEESWDPVEDAVEDERQSFVDMMKHLLWLQDVKEGGDGATNTSNQDLQPSKMDTPTKPAPNGRENVDPGKTLSKNARKRVKAKAKETAIEETDAITVEVNETREDMSKRLREGVKYDACEGIKGGLMAGTVDNPTATVGKIPGMPSAEVEKILAEVAEIKLFLFCRLLLSQAVILPAALRAESVIELLSDPEVGTNDLRDLCLKLEQPTLQQIRDACADFFRGDEESTDDAFADQEGEEEDQNGAGKQWLRYRNALPLKWRSKHEKKVDFGKQAMQAIRDDSTTLVEFGEINDDGFKNKKIRVKVCGKNIWNYPSEQAMARGGWLHFSIIAKGSKLGDAIELCRNWDEFWELNVLTLFKYFPSPQWGQWGGGQFRRQLLQLGFIPYLWFDEAQEYTMKRKSGGHGQGPRMHAATEYKNTIAGHIKRNDPVGRRLVQYLAMQAGHVQLLVRDAKTGRILVEPEEEHRWLVRGKGGLGRASRSEWTVYKSVDEDMFEQISGKTMRDWQFEFVEYYDIIVWDTWPGRPFSNLYCRVQEMLIKAHRFCTSIDMYDPMAPIVKSLRQERDTFRTRDVRPGEDSIYDDLHHEGSKFMFTAAPNGALGEVVEEAPPNWFYTDIDAAEDVVIFPAEVQGKHGTSILDTSDPIFKKLDQAGPGSRRFILGLDSDDDSDDYEEIEVDQPMSDRKDLIKLRKAPDTDHSSTKTLTFRDKSSNDGLRVQESDCTCSKCQIGEEELCEAWEDEFSDDGILLDADENDFETMKIFEALDEIEPDIMYGDDPERDFFQHLDRQKSKVFKQCWYDAIIDNEERADYIMSATMLDVLTGKDKMSRNDKKFCLKLLLWLQVHTHEHRLVWKDVQRAFATMSFFFPIEYAKNTSEPTMRQTARQRIADNTTRAQKHPYSRRTFKSNLSLSSEFWKQIDGFYEARSRAAVRNDGNYDRDSDRTIRPIVARWLKAGVIGPSHYEAAPGKCVALSEPGRQPDVYIDYRRTRSLWPSRNQQNITDPYSVDILKTAREFSASRTNARFALLRVWTHSHFCPLMLGRENREVMAFQDAIGRYWQWKFVPRDMAGSEWSMQKAVDIRIDPFKKQFGKQVVVKRDMLLVMAKGEEELKRFAVAVTFAVQTNPWSLDIDLWKSFVNVDLAFLEALDGAWVE